MPWTNEIDPTKPADSDPAAQGDDQFRELKAGLAERLGSRLIGWPTDQPLPLLAADVGDIAARPATPAGDGQVFLAHTPSKRLYYGFEGAWHEISALALLGDLIHTQLVTDSIEIPASSAQHTHTVPFTLAANEEVIAWRMRWRFPDFSVSFTEWTFSDARANYGASNPYTDAGTLVGLFYASVGLGNILFSFENRDAAPHVVDMEAFITRMQIS